MTPEVRQVRQMLTPKSQRRTPVQNLNEGGSLAIITFEKNDFRINGSLTEVLPANLPDLKIYKC
jgi:hypothetical protein